MLGVGGIAFFAVTVVAHGSPGTWHVQRLFLDTDAPCTNIKMEPPKPMMCLQHCRHNFIESYRSRAESAPKRHTTPSLFEEIQDLHPDVFSTFFIPSLARAS